MQCLATLLLALFIKLVVAKDCPRDKPCKNYLQGKQRCSRPEHGHMNKDGLPFCSHSNGFCVNADWCYDFRHQCDCGGSNFCRQSFGKCVEYANWGTQLCPVGTVECDGKGNELHKHKDKCPPHAPCGSYNDSKLQCSAPDYSTQKHGKPFCPAKAGKCMDRQHCYDSSGRKAEKESSKCKQWKPCHKEYGGEDLCFHPDYDFQNKFGKPFCSGHVGECSNKDWCYDESHKCDCGGAYPCRQLDGKCVPVANWTTLTCPSFTIKCNNK